MKSIDTNEWDELWLNRHATVSRMESEVDRCVLSGIESYDFFWRHARLEYFLALQAEETDPAAHARHLFAADIQAQKALKLEPNRVEGLFWAGIACIEAARVRGSLAAATAIKSARHNLQRAAELDEKFHEAGPYRVLGRIAHRAPRLLGGDLKLAQELYKRSLDIAYDNPTTLLYLAEAQRDAGDEATARRTLLRVLEGPVQTHWQWEQERDRRRARLLLSEPAAVKA